MENKYRSNFEKDFVKDLDARGIEFEYEKDRIEFFVKKRGKCFGCGGHSIAIVRQYTPDFKIGRMYIETKGRFTSHDRTKMRAVIASNPNLDIRMIFMYDNWCTLNKKQRYSDWCKRNGIKYAFNTMPVEWVGDAIGIRK